MLRDILFTIFICSIIDRVYALESVKLGLLALIARNP